MQALCLEWPGYSAYATIPTKLAKATIYSRRSGLPFCWCSNLRVVQFRQYSLRRQLSSRQHLRRFGVGDYPDLLRMDGLFFLVLGWLSRFHYELALGCKFMRVLRISNVLEQFQGYWRFPRGKDIEDVGRRSGSELSIGLLSEQFTDEMAWNDGASCVGSLRMLC